MADGSIIIDTTIDKKNLKKQLNDIKGDIDSFSKKIKKTLKGISIAGAGLFALAVKSASSLENITAEFTPLTGGAENAKNMIAALNKEAASTPFGLDDIAKASKQLLPILGNDIEAVTSTFRMLGDTAGGNAQKLDSITRGYTKAMMTGKVGMEALNMIADAGVPIHTQLAKSMGITVEEMTELSSSGKITSTDLTNAFKNMTAEGGLFFDGMAVASQTLSGKISTMKDNITQSLAEVGNIFLPVIKRIVDAINDAAKSFLDWAKEGNNLINFLKTVSDVLLPIVGGLGAAIVAYKTIIILTKAWAVAQALLNGTMAVNPIFIIVGAIALLVAGIIAIIRNWDYLYIQIQTTFAKIGQYFKIFGSMLQETFVVSINNIKIAFISLAGIIADKVLGAVANLLDIMGKMPFVGDKFQEASAKVRSLNDDINAGIEEAKENNRAIINGAKAKQDAIEEEAKKTLSLIEQERIARLKNLEVMKQESEEALKPQAVTQTTGGKKAGEEAGNQYVMGFSAKLRAAQSVLKSVGIETLKKGSKEYHKIGEMFGYDVADGYIKAQKKGMKDNQVDLVENAKNIFKNIIMAIQKVLQIGVKVVKGFVTAIKNTFSGIKNVIEKIVNFSGEDIFNNFKTIIDGLTNFFMKELPALPIFFQAGVDIFNDFLDGIEANSSNIMSTISNVITSIISIFNKNKDRWGQVIGDFINQLSITILNELPKILQFMGDVVIGMLKVAQEGFKKIVPVLVKVLSQLVTILAEIIPEILDIISEVVTSIATSILADKKIIRGFVELIFKIIEVIMKHSPDVLNIVIQLIIQLAEAITKNIHVILNAFFKLISAIIDVIVEMLPQIIRSMIRMFPILIQRILEQIPNMIGVFLNLISAIIQLIIELTPDFITSFILMFPQLVMAIFKAMPEIIAAFGRMGADVIGGFIKGVEKAGKNIFKKVKDGFEKFGKDVKKFFGIKSPSKMFAEMGGFLAEGLEEGFNEEGKDLYKNVSGTLEKFNSEVANNLQDQNILVGANTTAFDSVMSGLQANNFGLNADMSATNNQTIQLKSNINGNIQVDGRTLARIVFEHLDTVTRGAYGI